MLRTLVGAVACFFTFTGCSSFSVIAPEDGTVITLPATTPVTFEGKPRITNSNVTVNNGSAGAGSYNAASDRWHADLNLPAGRYAIAIQADVPCSYCSGGSFKHTATQNICVVAPGSNSAALKTPLAQADGQTWAAVNDKTISIEPDAGNPRTRWNFTRLGGFTSTDGVIESAAFPCRCLRSMDDLQNTPIGFYACNTADPLQQWQALQVPPFNANRYRIQNRGRGVSSACLTQGPAPDRRLIQRNCNDTPEQLWTVRDNTTMQMGSPY
jgi:hypothetical protein